MFDRWCAATLKRKFARPYVHLLFGARQTGKSTLLAGLIPDGALRFNFADPMERNREILFRRGICRSGLPMAPCREL